MGSAGRHVHQPDLLLRFRFYAPIDAAALQKYRIFSKMGFFPVEQDTFQGARNFLDCTQRILDQPSSAIWITPEGRFADARDTTAEFMPGLSHLAYTLARRNREAQRRIWFIPVAIEFTFWEERLPEILAWFGEPALVACDDRSSSSHVASESASNESSPRGLVSKEQWHSDLTSRLRTAQQKLAAASIARDDSVFKVLLSGQAGTSRVYDGWRRLWSRLTGKPIEMQHGQKLRESNSACSQFSSL